MLMECHLARTYLQSQLLMFLKSPYIIHSIDILLRKFVNRNTLFENDNYAGTDTLVIVGCFGKTLWPLHTDKSLFWLKVAEGERVCRAEGSMTEDGWSRKMSSLILKNKHEAQDKLMA